MKQAISGVARKVGDKWSCLFFDGRVNHPDQFSVHKRDNRDEVLYVHGRYFITQLTGGICTYDANRQQHVFYNFDETVTYIPDNYKLDKGGYIYSYLFKGETYLCVPEWICVDI